LIITRIVNVLKLFDIYLLGRCLRELFFGLVSGESSVFGKIFFGSVSGWAGLGDKIAIGWWVGEASVWWGSFQK